MGSKGKRKGRRKNDEKVLAIFPRILKLTEKATVEHCGLCGKDLSDQEPLESTNERIVEDISHTDRTRKEIL